LELISIECRKTKTKGITLANRKNNTDNPANQSKFNVKTCSWRKARENVYERVMIGFGFTSDWMKKRRVFFKASHLAWLCKPKAIAFRSTF